MNLVSRDGFGSPVPPQSAHSPYPGLIWCLLTGFLPSSAAAFIYLGKSTSKYRLELILYYLVIHSNSNSTRVWVLGQRSGKSKGRSKRKKIISKLAQTFPNIMSKIKSLRKPLQALNKCGTRRPKLFRRSSISKVGKLEKLGKCVSWVPLPIPRLIILHPTRGVSRVSRVCTDEVSGYTVVRISPLPLFITLVGWHCRELHNKRFPKQCSMFSMLGVSSVFGGQAT